MSNYLVTDTELTSVADAIRAKSGGSSGMTFPSGFVSEIGDLPVLDTSDATATAGDIAKLKTAYVNGSKVTGTYEPFLNEITDDLSTSFYLQKPNSENFTIATNVDTTLPLMTDSAVPYPKLTIFYEVESIKFNGTAQDKSLYDFTFDRASGTGVTKVKVRAKNSNVTVPNGSNGYKLVTVQAKAYYANVT